MPTDTRSQSPASSGSRHDTSLVIFATVADTTWRMFVPVLLGSLIGYGIDTALHSLPVGVLTGLGVGIVVAVLLVIAQYRTATKGRAA